MPVPGWIFLPGYEPTKEQLADVITWRRTRCQNLLNYSSVGEQFERVREEFYELFKYETKLAAIQAKETDGIIRM